MVFMHLGLQLLNWYLAVVVHIKFLKKVDNLLWRNRRVDDPNELIKTFEPQLSGLIKAHLAHQFP
jgi:hypothetical protein